MRLLPVVLGLAVPAVLVGTGSVLLAEEEPERLAVAAPAADGLVVRDGDRVAATGRVVSVPGRPVRFCAPVPRADIGYAPGQEPAPQYCDLGVDVDGVDLASLTDRREKAGAVEGWAHLVGTLTGGSLVVQQQEPRGGYDEADSGAPPPCEPPEGGWPRDHALLLPPGGEPEGDVNMHAEQPALDRYREQHPADVVTLALLRPHPDAVLMGVAVADEAAAARAEQALRPAYGQRLCVVVSRFSRAQVEAASTALAVGSGDAQRLGVFGSGEGVSDAMQVEVGYDVVVVTEEIARRAADHPAGLIALRPWLTPA